MNLRSLLIDEDKALPGRDESIKISSNHFVNDNRILEKHRIEKVFFQFLESNDN